MRTARPAFPVFRTGWAGEEESRTVRSLLDENGIAYYETPPSNFGACQASIWVYGKDEARRALELIGQYQSRLKKEARANFRRKHAHEHEGMPLWQKFLVLLLAFAGALLFLQNL